MSAGLEARDQMAFAGEVPWHRRGVSMGDKQVTIAKAKKASGLTWTVSQKPVKVGGIEVPDFKAIVRDDTGEVFNVLRGYEPIQNEDLWEVHDSVSGPGGAHVDTAGSLRNGRRVWILSKFPGVQEVVKDDVLERYILTASSHDGSLALRMLFTDIRVVCQNTLNMAIGHTIGQKVPNVFRVEHSIGVNGRLDPKTIKEVLGIGEQYQAAFMQGAKALARTKMNTKQFDAFLDFMFPTKALPAPTQRLLLAAPNPENYITSADGLLNAKKRELVTQLFVSGKGQDLPKVKGTSWAALNAVGEYIDFHHGKDETRDDSLLFGAGQRIKQKAWDYLTANVN